MLRFRRGFLVPIVAAGSLLIAACGTTASSASTAPATTAAAPTQAAVSGATTQKVNANTATQSELATAFTAAGISNAGRWAVEVVEYRPYPTDDPTFAKLRGELAKYNPDQATVDQIVSTLSL